MKFFAFIMAITVLALSCMPCTDGTSAIESSKVKTEFTKQASDQDSNHTDACSPFCQCSCCAGFSINHSITTVISLPIIDGNNFSSYLPDNLIEISLPVWQPPKM